MAKRPNKTFFDELRENGLSDQADRWLNVCESYRKGQIDTEFFMSEWTDIRKKLFDKLDPFMKIGGGLPRSWKV